jgi:hypothetical protein
MTSRMPASAQEHYENLLAEHYEWMFGLPFEAKVAEQKAILDEFAGISDFCVVRSRIRGARN